MAHSTQTTPTETTQGVQNHTDVKRALKQTSADRRKGWPSADKSDKRWLTGCLIMLGTGFLLRWLVNWLTLPVLARYHPILDTLATGLICVAGILAVARLVEVYLIGRVLNPIARFNLKRIVRLIDGLVLVMVVVSLLFANWYTAVVSLGLVSLLLGFALQAPITSFFGWVYLLVREPYRVGDRIKINEFTGDVIDVGYLDTTLWELGGEFLSTNHPSGRIIKFPNSQVFQTAVYNYSWPLFPYIWNEIKFHIGYESDLEFVSTVMQEVVTEEIGAEMTKGIETYRELLAKTPVDQLEVREHPVVQFRVSDNTWLEAIVRYLVHPKESGRVKTRLIKKLLIKLNAAPDRVLFPKSNAR